MGFVGLGLLEHCVEKDSEAAFELSRKELKSLSMRRGSGVREIKASTEIQSETGRQKTLCRVEEGDHEAQIKALSFRLLL